MLPDPPHLHLAMPTLGRFRKDLAASIWRDVSGPLPAARSEATHDHRPVAEADGLSFTPVTTLPHVWGREFDQCFWRLAIPPEQRSAGRYLRWDDQGEATLFHNAEPVYGFDPGHKHAPLPEGVDELLIESICCRTGVWVPGEHQGLSPEGSVFRGAFLAQRDDDAWSAYFDVETALGLAVAKLKLEFPDIADPLDPNGYRRPLHKLDPEVRRVLRVLLDAATAFGQGGAPAVRRMMEKVYADDALLAALDAAGRHEVVLTGHAHVDLVWLWPECVADFKAVHSFANALSVRKRYPEMTFGYSQPASYEAVARRSPATHAAAKSAIADGWWEVPGPAYVEFDTQLPCGEALIRSVELGQQGCHELGAGASRVLWLPDTFGYSACLPQVLRGLGVESFFSTKLSWSDSNVFPHSSFRWVGHDGSEVLAHLAHKYYNLDGQADDVLDIARLNRQADIHGRSLFPIGYGDGGGGVTDAMCERARRVGRLPHAPACRWGGIDDFYAGLAQDRYRLPAWHGEMYLAFHRAVATTLGELKASYRRAERALQRQEAAHVLADAGAIGDAGWKRVAFAQFHDYLPGSSILRVYDEALPELAGIAERAEAAVSEVLLDDADGPAWFNPLPVPQLVWTGEAWAQAPALSVTPEDVLEPLEVPAVRRSPRGLVSDRVEATFAPDGSVERLSLDGRPLAIEGGLNTLWSLDDRPAVYDAWNLDRAALSTGRRLEAHGEPEPVERDGKLGLRFALAFGASTAELTFWLAPASPVLEVELDIDFQEPWTLLKAAMGTGYRGTDARFGCPFGSVTRRQLPGSVEDDSRHEGAASRWAVVSDAAGDQGLMLITEAKYGMGASDGLLHLSLLRSVSYAGTGGGEGAGMGEGGDFSRGLLTDIGRHKIRYALGGFRADAPRADQPAQLAETLYQPAVPVAAAPARPGPIAALEAGDTLVASWARPWRDGVLLRFHETLGRRGSATLRLRDGWVGQPAEMDGEPMGDGVSSDVTLDFTPYRVVTAWARRASD
ncbi:MAG: glycoside hydrolase family 38 C-terminal domain-containing protein [Planctomycetota bacterium]